LAGVAAVAGDITAGAARAVALLASRVRRVSMAKISR
jgi:hypothetical protein